MNASRFKCRLLTGMLTGNSKSTRGAAVCDVVFKMNNTFSSFELYDFFPLNLHKSCIPENSLYIKTVKKCFVYTCKKICSVVVFTREAERAILGSLCQLFCVLQDAWHLRHPLIRCQ